MSTWRQVGKDTLDATDREPLLSFPEAAEYLGITPNTLRKYVREGVLPAFRLVGTRRVVRIRKADVDRCLVPWTKPVRDRLYGGER